MTLDRSSQPRAEFTLPQPVGAGRDHSLEIAYAFSAVLDVLDRALRETSSLAQVEVRAYQSGQEPFRVEKRSTLVDIEKFKLLNVVTKLQEAHFLAQSMIGHAHRDRSHE